MTNEAAALGGFDSHKDTIHVAVITSIGQPVADCESPTTSGYRSRRLLIAHVPLHAVGVEGTGSYGVGITTAVTQAGIRVVGGQLDQGQPSDASRQERPPDAYHAARSVLSGEANADPKSASIEPLRQIRAMLIDAPTTLRDQYCDLSPANSLPSLPVRAPTG